MIYVEGVILILCFIFKENMCEKKKVGPPIISPENDFFNRIILSKSMPLAKQLTNAERDPSVALMALATNSGLGRFLDSSQQSKFNKANQISKADTHWPFFVFY
jgi:hypothetical protein